MCTLLGQRFGGWIGSLSALAVGTFAPAIIAITLAAVYVAHVHNPLAKFMQGARAGALAVFMWAIVRCVRPQLRQHSRRGTAIALTTLVMALVLPIPPFVVLLIAGESERRSSLVGRECSGSLLHASAGDRPFGSADSRPCRSSARTSLCIAQS